MCRTCQSDETCALCHDCFSHSNHEGHDVAFFHAQEGGCCDCGDPEAWDPKGFCPKHGNPASSAVTPRRRVCQKPFKRGDIVYMCRTCQTDETCALCHECFSQSNHEGHDVAFFQHQQDEGCCDCGDPEAWDPKGFCPNHGPPKEGEGDSQQSPEGLLPAGLVPRVRGVVPAVMDWMVHRLAQSASAGSKRTMLPLSSAESSLAPLGRQGHGLYLVIQSDDVHTQREVGEALQEFFGRQCNFDYASVTKLAQLLATAGQLVLWGPMELAGDCGREKVRAWLEGDPNASSAVIASLVKRAVALKRHRFYCRIVTLQELQEEQQAIAVMQWMSSLAFSCDPICQTIAEYMRPQQHLIPLLEADFVLSARFTKIWYSLLLTLLAVPAFKTNLGTAYCATYDKLTEESSKGKGVLERSAYALSVQFLNRDAYVLDLVTKRDLLAKLARSLLATLRAAEIPGLRRLNPNNLVLGHRRYSPCISDLNYVINVKGMKRLTTSERTTFLDDLVSAVSLAQCMDPHTWRHWDLGHVLEEDLGWYGAFNLCITLGGFFDRLLSFDDDEPSPIQDLSSPLTSGLLTCEEFAYKLLLQGITSWQNETMQEFQPTPYISAMDSHRRRPASLPFSTVAAKYGCTAAFRQLPVGQSTPFSLHLPLHRFLASCIRELCLRPPERGLQRLIDRLCNDLSEAALDNLFFGLLEFPLLVLSRSAQVRAGLWKRNGPGLAEQVSKYADPTFCRSMRDSDIVLLQFAVLKRRLDQSPTPRPKSDVSMSLFVHLLIHRLGLFEFVGLSKAPNADPDSYEAEVSKGLYPRECGEDNGSKSALVLPWTYSCARDASDCRALMEELLFLLIVFATELPFAVPPDKSGHVEQARLRLKREVVHRLAASPKTHSELADIYLVLSFRDNMLLNEEGKLINPDDATAAMLGKVLEIVAERKASRSRLEPDKFVLIKSEWASYDPSFYHISVEGHQTAAESRPTPSVKDEDNMGKFGVTMPYAPATPPAHPGFERLRRDVTADATVLAIIFRILHMHCSAKTRPDLVDLRVGRLAYVNEAKSEISLARAVHLLTIGCYAWEQARSEANDWRDNGGGSPGSVFFDREEPPLIADWVSAAFLTDPKDLLECDWYEGEDNAFLLIRRLAVDGGASGNFVAQDPAVQAGAAWLCEFAVKNCPAVKVVVNGTFSGAVTAGFDEKNESEIDRRKRLAKERALANMNAQAAKFKALTQTELQDDDDDEEGGLSSKQQVEESDFERRKRQAKEKVMAKMSSQAAKFASSVGIDADHKSRKEKASDDNQESEFEQKKRLARDRAMTLINNHASKFASSMGLELGTEEEKVETDLEKRRGLAKERALAKINNAASNFASMMDIEIESKDDTEVMDVKVGASGSPISKPRRLLQERPQCIICSDSDAECFVAFTQGSTVLKGGGGSHQTGDHRMSSVQRFVGSHVALCGHAVHSDCSASYLAKVHLKSDQGNGEIIEFRCPLCQRPSNCLVPFVDVGSDWVNVQMQTPGSRGAKPVLASFLEKTKWWVSRQNDNIIWNGQSSFIDTSADTDTYDAEEAVGEVTVLKNLMEHICGISYAADSTRLGNDELRQDLGEFRHYIVEKHAYNKIRTSVGNEPSKWPQCVLTDEVSNQQFQSISREKVLSQLLKSIECLTYSVCCESFEARRRIADSRETTDHLVAAMPTTGDGTLKSILSKFGIQGSVCDGQLILMPPPSSTEDHGSQPFNGRFGRLRYLALALMAAAGAVGPDLVQLVLQFPSKTRNESQSKLSRAPIAYPILLGNILTHVIAAACASSGEIVAPDSWSRSFKGAFLLPGTGQTRISVAASVAEDCEAFLKLGLLARVLQVLCKEVNVRPNNLSSITSAIACMNIEATTCSSEEKDWLLSCRSLLKNAISKETELKDSTRTTSTAEDLEATYRHACNLAAAAAAAFLADAGTVIQLLVPGFIAQYEMQSLSRWTEVDDERSGLGKLQNLCRLFNIESIDQMLESPLVCEIVMKWFSDANQHIQKATKGTETSDALAASLYQTQGFRSWDWPLLSVLDYHGCTDPYVHVPSHTTATATSKRPVPFLGGFNFDAQKAKGKKRLFVDALTSSYMDLYAKVGTLKPDSDRTAICLICGEALDASGTGECTRHSYNCGAGTGICFLLQECVGLIMHRSEGSYIHSIYVDAHGETPRGRPLYLDLARYEHIRELWVGHMIRQQVIAERESTQQGVVRGYY